MSTLKTKATPATSANTSPSLPGGELAPAPKNQDQNENGELVQWSSENEKVLCTLPPSHPMYDKIILSALGMTTKKTRNVVGDWLTIVAVVKHPVEVTDEMTGEVKLKQRYVMLLDNGSTVSTMADGVVRVLNFKVARKGPGPWKQSLMMLLEEVQLEGGKSCVLVKEVK